MDRLAGKCDFFAYADDVAIVKRIETQEDKEQFHLILQTLLEWAEEFGMNW